MVLLLLFFLVLPLCNLRKVISLGLGTVRGEIVNRLFCIFAGSSPTFDGDCKEGYYCKLGSYTPTPTDGVTGEECQVGHFCVSGTLAPESCPSGTFSNSRGLRNIQECTNCTPGMFCNGSALTAPSGDCWPRYYCSGRAEHPAPQDGITGGNCTPGHYCPGRTPDPVPCEVRKKISRLNIIRKPGT